MKYTVLIVDDEKDVVDSVSLLLESEGYKAIGVTRGEQIMDAYAANERMDVIILDLDMPYMTGAEVLRTLRQFFEKRNIPIIVYSAAIEKGRADLVEQALANKPYKYIDKGNHDELLIAIDTVLRLLNPKRRLTEEEHKEMMELEVYRKSLEKTYAEKKINIMDGLALQDRDVKCLRYYELKAVDMGEESEAERYAAKRERLERMNKLL